MYWEIILSLGDLKGWSKNVINITVDEQQHMTNASYTNTSYQLWSPFLYTGVHISGPQVHMRCQNKKRAPDKKLSEWDFHGIFCAFIICVKPAHLLQPLFREYALLLWFGLLLTFLWRWRFWVWSPGLMFDTISSFKSSLSDTVLGKWTTALSQFT